MTLQRIRITHVDKARLQVVIDRARQAENQSRPYLDDLQRELDRADVIDPASIPDGLVTMNSAVRVRDLDSDETETYTLVFPEDSDIQRHRISILAPVGTALIGCQTGDVVTWSVPRGRVQLRIEDVCAPSPLPHVPIAGAVLCPS